MKVKRERDPNGGKRHFADSSNAKVESVLERKRKVNWINKLWKDYSVFIILAMVVLGIVALAKATQ